MRAADIKDRETLEAWLRGRPEQDAIVIAHRAALRVLPIWGAAMGEDWTRKGDLTALPVLHCGLISAVAGSLPAADIQDASRFAAAAAAGSAVDADAPDDAFSAAAAAVDATFASAVDAASAAALAVTLVDAYALVRADAEIVEGEGNPVRAALWSGKMPKALAQAERAMLAIWDSEPAARWAFWRRWWAGAKAGAPIDPQLQLAIVQGIDEETWKDTDAVAARIVEIEREFRDGLGGVAQDLLDLPPAPTSVVATVRQAMVQHREALPATFETILGYILLEVARLQARNYRDDDDAVEAQRQIRTLTTIYEAVERLSALVPDSPDMPEGEAEEAEKLSRLIFRRFCDWPRAKPGVFEDNAADLADSAYRAALVGGFACLAPMIGTAPDKALIAGAVLFGGKKIVDTAKAAKEAFGSDK